MNMVMGKQTNESTGSMALNRDAAYNPCPEDTSRTLDLWRNIYRFYYTFRDMENTTDAWTRCWTSMMGILHLYDNNPLAQGLLFAVTEWIEKRMKDEYAVS